MIMSMILKTKSSYYKQKEALIEKATPSFASGIQRLGHISLGIKR